MIRRPPRSTLFPTRRSSDLTARPTSTVSAAWCAGSCSSHTASSASRTMQRARSEEHTSELQSRRDLVCRLLLEKKKNKNKTKTKLKNKTKIKINQHTYITS